MNRHLLTDGSDRDGGDDSNMSQSSSCFTESSLSGHRPGSRMIEAGWILLELSWTKQFRLFSFARFDCDENHIVSVLSAFSCRRHDWHVSSVCQCCEVGSCRRSESRQPHSMPTQQISDVLK